MPPLHERLAEARDRFVRAGIPREEATLDAELLARHVLGCDRATFVTRARDPLPSAFDRLYEAVVERRVNREPMAYILGHREFWGLEFEVTPDVLIPRPETELIVEEALAAMPAREAVRRIVDVGTGSGCLAIVLAIEFSSAQVTATDVSEAALSVAHRNCHRHHVTDRVSLVTGHLLDGVEKSADVIVSNPPYVPATEAADLQPEVADYEPATALYAGVDGLGVIRQLLADAPPHLNGGGRLFVEFGLGQEAAIHEEARRNGWTVERIRRDLQSIPRVAVLRR
jgi:release factor glutamine methyltransferase